MDFPEKEAVSNSRAEKAQDYRCVGLSSGLLSEVLRSQAGCVDAVPYRESLLESCSLES